MLNDKIEFYGEMLSMRAIALRIGVSRETLLKYFDKFKDIYEAEKVCRKIMEEKNESLIEYKGEAFENKNGFYDHLQPKDRTANEM